VLPIFAYIKKNVLTWANYMTAYGKAVKAGYKSNAFSPIAWFSIFIIVPLVTGILICKNFTIQIILILLLSLVVLFTLFVYAVLLVKNPKLLQSEKYRLEEQKLNMISEKGGKIRIVDVDLGSNTKIGGPEDE
jgi:hypothetical protein